MEKYTFEFTLAQLELARLGVLAAKRGLTVNDLVKQAVRTLLEQNPMRLYPDPEPRTAPAVTNQPWFEIRVSDLSPHSYQLHRSIPLTADWPEVRMLFNLAIRDVDPTAKLVLVTPNGEIMCDQGGQPDTGIDGCQLVEIMRHKHRRPPHPHNGTTLRMDSATELSLFNDNGAHLAGWLVAPAMAEALIRAGEI
jgi:hypothetical protein